MLGCGGGDTRLGLPCVIGCPRGGGPFLPTGARPQDATHGIKMNRSGADIRRNPHYRLSDASPEYPSIIFVSGIIPYVR
jgi:hypothetical protein